MRDWRGVGGDLGFGRDAPDDGEIGAAEERGLVGEGGGLESGIPQRRFNELVDLRRIPLDVSDAAVQRRVGIRGRRKQGQNGEDGGGAPRQPPKFESA